MNQRIRRAALSALFGVIFLTGCATVGAPPEEAVTKRAQERWDAILSGDLAGAYEYLSPGFRSGVSSIAWQRQLLTRRISYTGARATGSECAEETCKVSISIDYDVIGTLPGVPRFSRTSQIDEDWIRIDREWYLVPAR